MAMRCGANKWKSMCIAASGSCGPFIQPSGVNAHTDDTVNCFLEPARGPPLPMDLRCGSQSLWEVASSLQDERFWLRHFTEPEYEFLQTHVLNQQPAFEVRHPATRQCVRKQEASESVDGRRGSFVRATTRLMAWDGRLAARLGRRLTAWAWLTLVGCATRVYVPRPDMLLVRRFWARAPTIGQLCRSWPATKSTLRKRPNPRASPARSASRRARTARCVLRGRVFVWSSTYRPFAHVAGHNRPIPMPLQLLPRVASRGSCAIRRRFGCVCARRSWTTWWTRLCSRSTRARTSRAASPKRWYV